MRLPIVFAFLTQSDAVARRKINKGSRAIRRGCSRGSRYLSPCPKRGAERSSDLGLRENLIGVPSPEIPSAST